MKSNRLKVLLWDIETLPNIAVSFGVWDQNLSPAAILNTTSICSVSFKWLGGGKVWNRSIRDYEGWANNPHDDQKLVSDVKKDLEQADVLIHHNGDKFDIKFLNARLLANGLTGLPKIQTIDTYKVAKSKFYLNSNKLDYLAKLLGVEQKLPMTMADWIGVINGSTKAVAKMEQYNSQDVLVLEEVYERLRSFIPSHPNFNLLQESDDSCPTCGSKKLEKRGFHYTRTSKKQRFCCKSCGSWSHSGKSETLVDVRSE